MIQHKQLLMLIINTTITAAILGLAYYFYAVTLNQYSQQLIAITDTNTRLINLVPTSRLSTEKSLDDSAVRAKLSQRLTVLFAPFTDATPNFNIAIGTQQGEQIHYLYNSAENRPNENKAQAQPSVSVNNQRAKAMTLALSGQQGIHFGTSQSGHEVIAAYQFSKVHDLGIVVQKPVADLRQVYINGVLVVWLMAMVLSNLLVKALKYYQFRNPPQQRRRREDKDNSVALEARGRDERLKNQQTAMFKLAHQHIGANIDNAINLAIETSAKTLDVERVSVWNFNADRTTIRCRVLYELSLDQHNNGHELLASEYPMYFDALYSNRVIAASDVYNHPATQEFCQHYFPEYGITSMLDAPIRRGEDIIGVVCHEHTGSPRHWTVDEQIFASSVADMISLHTELWEHKLAKQALADSESCLAGIIQIARDAIISINEDHTISLFNEGAERIFGYSKNEMLGKSLNCILPKRLRKKHTNLIKEFSTSDDVGRTMAPSTPLYGLHKNGKEFPLEATISKLTLGGRITYTATVRDISKRKQAEAELHKYQRHLEGLIRDRTRELTLVRDHALHTNHNKDLFLSAMSHELRTPLNAIIGFTGLLKDGISGPINDQQLEQLSLIHDNAKRLLSDINNVVDLSKIEIGNINIQNDEFRVENLFTELRDYFYTSAHAKGIEIKIEIDQPDLGIYTDRIKLQQILSNVVANAIQSSRQGTLTFHAISSEFNLRIEVIIKYNGATDSTLESAIDSHHYYDSKGKQMRNGFGLGLTVCQHFTKLLGGTFAIEHTATGSTFSVNLTNIVRDSAIPISDMDDQGISHTHH